MNKRFCTNLVLLCLLILTSCSKSKESAKELNQEEIKNWNLSSIEIGNLDFGLVDFDKQKLLKIDIINDGTENISTPLTISSADFQLVLNSCSSLLIGEKCSIKISFNAKGKSENSYTANLFFGSTVNVLTAQINRSGEILNSSFVNNGLPISLYDFGNIEFSHLLLKSFFIKNTGTLNQTENVSIIGTDFSLVYDACSGKQIKPQGQCLVKVLLSGQGKSGVISNNLTYGLKNLPLSANVKTQSEVAQESSEFVFVYNNQIATGPLNFETLNLNSFKEFKVYVKNVGTRAGKVLNSDYADKLNVFYNGCDNVSLNPNQTCLLRAHLNSQTKGSFSTTLSANVDYQTNSQSVQWIVREPGDKIDCSLNIANAQLAEITWTGSTYTSCELISCNTNFHKLNNTCENDTLSCSDIQGSGIKHWNETEFDNCEYASCNSGYFLSGQSCLTQICSPNSTAVCSITNGSGIKTCNTEGSLYGSCMLSSCDAGFHQNNNVCDSDVISCSDAIGSGLQTWNGSSYGSCSYSSCNSGYYLSGNSCLPQICSPNSVGSCPTGVAGEEGSQTCNAQGSAYGSCSYSSCSIGYVRNQANTQCVLAEATGGNLIQTIGDYKIHTFTSTGTNNFIMNAGSPSVSVEYLIIAGGGGGGGAFAFGGGGAGGFKTSTVNITSGTLPVVVGAGGIGSKAAMSLATNGGDSSFAGIISTGGGAGSGEDASAHPGGFNGGSGGGAGYDTVSIIGLGMSPQGNNGGMGASASINYRGGGGGGAGGVGGNPTASVSGNGGIGRQSDINGTMKYYAGGGAGGVGGNSSGSLGSGGNGGGGSAGGNGLVNSGSGGGSGYSSNSQTYGSVWGGNGGSGIVIIKYKYK